MSMDESAKRLSLAAAELVKAAYKQTEDINIDIQREVADNISDIKVESIALKTDMNNKFNTVNQNLQENRKTMESLMTAMTSLNTTMTEEGKKNRIVNALNSERKPARGWCFNENGKDGSESLIRNILSAFLEDDGCYIDTYHSGIYADGPTEEESKKAFRDKLKSEIMIITGTIPTIKLTDDRWAIFHG